MQDVEPEALKIVKLLTGPKTAAARDAYAFLEKAPLDLLAYILAESNNGKAVGKIKTYFSKWKPIRQALPGVAAELEVLGMERGPKFDKVVEDFFQLQLLGRARKPEDHAKILRKLAGIKELPKESGRKEKAGKAEEERRDAFQAGNNRGDWAGHSSENTTSPYGAGKSFSRPYGEAET